MYYSLLMVNTDKFQICIARNTGQLPINIVTGRHAYNVIDLSLCVMALQAYM